MNDVSATGLGTPGPDWFIFVHRIGNDKALHNLCSGELALIMPLSFSILIYTFKYVKKSLWNAITLDLFNSPGGLAFISLYLTFPSQTLLGWSLYKPIALLSKYFTWNNNDNKNQIRHFLTTAGLIQEPSLVRMVCYLYTQNLCLFQVPTVSKTKHWLFCFVFFFDEVPIGAFKHLASPTGKHTIQTPFMLTVNAHSSAAKHPTKLSEILSADCLVPPFGTILFKTLTGTGRGFYWESTISNRSWSWVSCVCWIKVRIKQFIGLLD